MRFPEYPDDNDPRAPWNEVEPCYLCDEPATHTGYCGSHDKSDACVDCEEALGVECGRCSKCAEAHAGTE